MSRSILVAVDDSEQSTRALKTALASFADPEITVIHVLDPAELARYGGREGNVMTDFEEIQKRREEAAENLLDEAKEIATEQGVVGRRSRHSAPPSESIDPRERFVHWMSSTGKHVNRDTDDTTYHRSGSRF